jgi:hypothetical protein
MDNSNKVMSLTAEQHQLRTRYYAKSLYDAAFKQPCLPRSLQYKQGLLSALNFRSVGDPITNPYRPGTTESDAFLSGLEAGLSIWKERGT